MCVCVAYVQWFLKDVVRVWLYRWLSALGLLLGQELGWGAASPGTLLFLSYSLGVAGLAVLCFLQECLGLELRASCLHIKNPLGMFQSVQESPSHRFI